MNFHRLVLEVSIGVWILQGIVLFFLFVDIPTGGKTELFKFVEFFKTDHVMRFAVHRLRLFAIHSAVV